MGGVKTKGSKNNGGEQKQRERIKQRRQKQLGGHKGRERNGNVKTNYYERMTIMSKQMKNLLALIIVSMLTVLCACNR